MQTGIPDAITRVNAGYSLRINLHFEEDVMKTIVESTRTSETEVTHDVLSILATLVSASALLIGIWAIACFASALLSHGLTGLVRGYITAITGF